MQPSRFSSWSWRLSPALHARLGEGCASAALAAELEAVEQRAAELDAPADDVALAVGIVLALATPRNRAV